MLKTVSRRYRKIHLQNFAAYLTDRLALSCYDINQASLDELLSCFESVIGSTLDAHAPLQEFVLKGNTKKPWYNDQIHTERVKMRAYERKAIKSGLKVHKQMFRAQRNVVMRIIDDAKAAFFRQRK